MEYVLKNEVTGTFSTINKQLSDLNLAILGYDPSLPLSLADLGSDITAYYNPAKFYQKGEPIAVSDLPTVPTKAYIDGRTRGVTSLVTATQMIGEVVAARESEVDLVTNLGNYSLKTGLITNINALSSGTINKARTEPQDHNSLTNRTIADAHPTSAITNLDTTLGTKTANATILATINASTEVTKIDPTQIQPISHLDLDDTSSADCHPTSAITNLDTGLAAGADAKTQIDNVLSGTGYASLDEIVDCLRRYLQNIDGVGLPNAPICWEIIV